MLSVTVANSLLLYPAGMGVDLEGLRTKIYCHRGYWNSQLEPNSKNSILKAVDFGFNVETDIRDLNGSIVISHDPTSASEMFIEDLPSGSRAFALNLKSDGLLSLNNYHFESILKVEGSFVFDGSLPEMLHYRRKGLPHALRISEYETELPWASEYIWLDAFESDWWLSGDVLRKFSDDRIVVVVSPELHKRNYSNVWQTVSDELKAGNPNVAICTDFPDKFMEMFL